MTVTLIPQHLADQTDVDDGHEVELEHAQADLQQLAALLAQAYVALPLFP
jgi:hypothetical protein